MSTKEDHLLENVNGLKFKSETSINSNAIFGCNHLNCKHNFQAGQVRTGNVFNITKQIGKGGQSTVYLGETCNGDIALKLTKDDGEVLDHTEYNAQCDYWDMANKENSPNLIVKAMAFLELEINTSKYSVIIMEHYHANIMELKTQGFEVSRRCYKKILNDIGKIILIREKWNKNRQNHINCHGDIKVNYNFESF